MKNILKHFLKINQTNGIKITLKFIIFVKIIYDYYLVILIQLYLRHVAK